MPPLTLLELQPEAQLEFPVGGSGPVCARLRLSNAVGSLVAYKVKATAPKSYAIKPSAGSIRRGEAVEVQIVRKAVDDEPSAADVGASSEAGATAPVRDKRPDRFLVQAAVVDSDEKKLLLHAAQRGKAAGAAKFWDGVPKDALEERQLVAVLVEAGASGAVSGAPGEETTEARRPMSRLTKAAAYGRDGMPSNEDVDAIIGKLSLPGRSQLAMPQVDLGARGPPGLGASPGLGADASGTPGAEDTAACAPPPPTWKKPCQKRKEDIVLQKHSRPVTFVTLDPTGKVLFTCGKDKLVIAWSCPEGEYLRWYEGHRGAVWACSVSPDGILLLTCGADSLVLLWDAASARQLAEVQMPGVVRCVEWAPGTSLAQVRQRRFIACSNSFKSRPAALALLDFNGLVPGGQGSNEARGLLTIEEPTLPSSATQVAWAGAHGSHLCSVHASGEVFFWHAGTGAMLGRLEAHQGPVSQVAFPQDRSLMATCGRVDMQVKLWDLGVGVAPGQAVLLRSCLSDRPLNAVAVRPSLSREQVLIAAADARRCDCLAGGGQDARDVALVGAGTDDQFDPLPLRVGSEAEVLEEYFVPGSEERHKGGGHFGPIHALAFCMDGALCISGSEDGNVRMRELSAQSTDQSVAEAVVQFSEQCAVQAKPHPAAQHVKRATKPSPQEAAQPSAKPAVRAKPAAQSAAQSAPQAVTQSTVQPALQPVQPTGGSIRAVAACDFDPSSIGWPPAAPQRPLPLRRGQEIEVVQDAGSGWTWGHPVGYPALLGLFPTSYVLALSTYQELLQQACAQEAASALPRKDLLQQAEAHTEKSALLTKAHTDQAVDDEDGDCSQS